MQKITKSKNVAQELPDSNSLADQTQTVSSKSAVVVHQGDASSETSDNVKSLSKEQQGKIAQLVRACYTQDIVAKNYATYVTHMVVTVDSNGNARIVDFDVETKAKMRRDSAYRRFAERSRDAVLNPRCSKLPIPSNMLEGKNTIRFVFRP